MPDWLLWFLAMQAMSFWVAVVVGLVVHGLGRRAPIETPTEPIGLVDGLDNPEVDKWP